LRDGRAEKKLQRSRLVSGEYLTVHDGQDTQTAAARSQLIEVAKEIVPRFLEELREGVYPYFASSAGENENYYQYGWRFRNWARVSDPDGRVKGRLLAWARKYRADDEWVLQGALSTLKRWHHNPALLLQLETRGFHLPVAGEILIADEEHYFEISDWGWPPSFLAGRLSIRGSQRSSEKN
jgi:hypothetical protein